MKDLCLSNKTREDIERLCRTPPHALLIIGQTAIGKTTLSKYISGKLLEIEDTDSYPYALSIRPDGKSISIESVRQMDHFLNLKVPTDKRPNRIVIIEEAEKLTLEAQNALLKTLEEPPADTVIMLLCSNLNSVLPTIRSRAQKLHIIPPDEQSLRDFFSNIDDQRFNSAYLMSGGLPGLFSAIVEDTDHPLVRATTDARSILSKNIYERNLLVNNLAKDTNKLKDIIQILEQMAEVSLRRGSDTIRWRRVLTSAYEARTELDNNAQAKLVLLKLMLSL